LAVDLQFIFEYGSRGGDFSSSGRLFHKGTILLKKETSEIGSSAKVGSVARGSDDGYIGSGQYQWKVTYL
jgi:hypothetical protein